MSSKTPRADDDATASAPKNRQLRLLVAVCLLIFGGYLVFSGVSNTFDSKKTFIAPNRQTLNVEIVSTPEEKTLGLSGRESIGTNSGMLFVYDNSSKAICLWMKDMKFSIDMVWLDENKKVVDVVSQVAPDTYPQSFCPKQDARYVLEIAAGRAKELGLKEGEQTQF